MNSQTGSLAYYEVTTRPIGNVGWHKPAGANLLYPRRIGITILGGSTTNLMEVR
ncbi:hypothetical protein [Algoriphagus aquimarinus]|uniref:hypothetical protein n=1 Tax=Algoriphagus aquimarinus TaxID=237018 RepID=UPI0030DC96B9